MRSVIIGALLVLSACSRQVPKDNNSPPWAKSKELAAKYEAACSRGTSLARYILTWPESERTTNKNYTFSIRLSPTSDGEAQIMYNNSNVPTIIVYDALYEGSRSMGSLIDYYVFEAVNSVGTRGPISEEQLLRIPSGEYFCFSEFID